MGTTRNTITLKKILVAMTLVFSLMLLLQGCSDSETNSTSKTVPATTSTKKITKAQYEEAKKEHKQLVATNQQLDKSLKDTDQQRQQIESQESEAENAVADEQNAAQASNADSGSTAQTNQNQQNTNNDTGIVHGGSSQYIIGNVNSHVYHMPGQRGYTMKSKNAVYFQSEQEAINAGYRKAKQ